MADRGAFGPYVNARVRAMKSALLGRAEIDTHLVNGNLDTMVKTLVASPYEQEMAEALTRYEGVDAVEDGVSRNLVNTFAKLRRLAAGPYDALAQIFVGRWDLIAVKALLRNRHHGLDADTGGASLFPGPSMPVALLRELASQNAMDGVVRGLAAWNSKMCETLIDKLPEYQETVRLRPLEEALDSSYFVRNVRRLGGSQEESVQFVRRLLRMEIDRINLRTLFESQGADTSPEDVQSRLLPRGLLGDHVTRAMAAAHSPEAAIGMLEGTPYAILTEGLEEFVQTQRFSCFERLFETAFLSRLKRAALHQGIGLAPLLHYGWLKYNEVMNLRVIARGLSVRLPAARLREEIMYG